IYLGASEICFPDIGCFKKFFHHIYRPVSLLPADPKKIAVVYKLFTRQNPTDHDVIKYNSEASVKKSHFNPKLNTKIIVHGYLDNQFFGTWMGTMKDEFIIAGDFNIFNFSIYSLF